MVVAAEVVVVVAVDGEDVVVDSSTKWPWMSRIKVSNYSKGRLDLVGVC